MLLEWENRQTFFMDSMKKVGMHDEKQKRSRDWHWSRRIEADRGQIKNEIQVWIWVSGEENEKVRVDFRRRYDVGRAGRGVRTERSHGYSGSNETGADSDPRADSYSRADRDSRAASTPACLHGGSVAFRIGNVAQRNVH